MTTTYEGGGEWVAAYKAPDQWRAELVRSWLAEAGIPVLVHTYAVGGYNMLMGGTGDCWAELRVPSSSLAAAQEVMRSFMDGEEGDDDGR
jgi:hypothetical protein